MFDMKKQLMWSQLKVGVVISIALALLLLTVFFAGGVGDLFTPKVVIRAEIKDVKGLRRGAPVWVSGIEIGFVKHISLNSEYGTLVTMLIQKSALPYIRNDSNANVITQGLLGDKYIELTGGTLEAGQIKPGSIIKGAAQLEVKDLVEASAKSMAKVTEFVNRVDMILEHFGKSEGTVAKLLRDPSLYNNLKESSSMLLAFLKDLNESEGSAKMFIKDPSVYNNMLAASSSLEKFTRSINEGDGTLRRLAESPELYDNLSNASRKLDDILSEINSGKGTAGTLLRDKELPADIKETVAGLKDAVDELRDLTKDVRAHPGKYFKFSIF
ncbi:MAG: MlaD family protein [Dissulfurispiraceae bacterium]|jgi:phospholipid/cholesterol/gamma-HCH transport system substrate-binding protein